jgi:hypothetical protein
MEEDIGMGYGVDLTDLKMKLYIREGTNNSKTEYRCIAI